MREDDVRDDLSTRGIERQSRRMSRGIGSEKERLAQALRDGDTKTFTEAAHAAQPRPEQDIEILRTKAWRLCEAIADKAAADGLYASGHVGWKEQMDAEATFVAALKDLRTACDGRHR